MDIFDQMRQTLSALIAPDSSEDLIAAASRALDWLNT
jgi:hypothetical protein